MQRTTVEQEFQTQFVTAGSLLYSVEHRPWLPPDGQWLLSQRWNNLLLAHYAFAPQTLRRLVPPELTLELYDGAAWLSVVPFFANHVRPSGVPPLPVISQFAQVNVRTYVTLDGKAGVYYLSVDTANLSAVWFARVFFRMQYWHSSIQMSGGTARASRPEGEAIRFRSSRLHGPEAAAGPAAFDVSYMPDSAMWGARPGTLDAFLVERYCVYSWHRSKIYRTELHHQPWTLQAVEVEVGANSLAEPLGLTLSTQPQLCHFSRSLRMLAWAPQSLQIPR